MPEPSNTAIAAIFDDIATRLDVQGALPYRVRAWSRGADALRELPRPASEIFAAEGVAGLEALDHIGRRLARAIIEILRTGRSTVQQRLRGEVGPHRLFASLPGIGEVLADRIHHELGIETLEALELAAHDGRLEAVEGVGPSRARAVREVLATRLGHGGRRRTPTRSAGRGRTRRPDVATVLDVDAQYRKQAGRGQLPTIAPRRFNPDGKAWLPILHTDRGPWSFTALFSNTALAHRLHHTHDWVVIVYEDDHVHDQCTVVTEWRGALQGKRVIRGRERQCAAHYAELDAAKPR